MDVVIRLGVRIEMHWPLFSIGTLQLNSSQTEFIVYTVARKMLKINMVNTQNSRQCSCRCPRQSHAADHDSTDVSTFRLVSNVKASPSIFGQSTNPINP